MRSTFLKIVWDDKKRRWYVWHPDDPSRPLHELSMNAIVELTKKVCQFEDDCWRENNKGIR